jgi:hypothetical protein
MQKISHISYETIDGVIYASAWDRDQLIRIDSVDTKRGQTKEQLDQVIAMRFGQAEWAWHWNEKQRIALRAVFDRSPVYPQGSNVLKTLRDRGWEFHVKYDHNANPVAMYWEQADASNTFCFKDQNDIIAHYKYLTPLTFEEFNASVMNGDSGSICVWTDGIFIGIETDGYAHS